MSNNKQCQFEPNTNTSSATICKWCGKEKWQHDNKQTFKLKSIDDNYKIDINENGAIILTKIQGDNK